MDTGIIQAVWTIIVMVIFISIFLWAWSKRNKKSFDSASRIPMNDDDPVDDSSARMEHDNG